MSWDLSFNKVMMGGLGRRRTATSAHTGSTRGPFYDSASEICSRIYGGHTKLSPNNASSEGSKPGSIDILVSINCVFNYALKLSYNKLFNEKTFQQLVAILSKL